MSAEITTCSTSLLEPGVCCMNDCESKADVAVLSPQMVEHAVCYRCEYYTPSVSRKPLLWSKVWGPTA